MDRWDADGCGIERQACSEEFGELCEGRDVVGCGESGAALVVGFNESR